MKTGYGREEKKEWWQVVSRGDLQRRKRKDGRWEETVVESMTKCRWDKSKTIQSFARLFPRAQVDGIIES